MCTCPDSCILIETVTVKCGTGTMEFVEEVNSLNRFTNNLTHQLAHFSTSIPTDIKQASSL